MPLHSHNLAHKQIPVRESPAYPTFGFLLSIIFTLAAFALVTLNAITTQALSLILVLLALAQLFVQFYFFFHLGDPRAKRLNTAMGALAAFSLLVIVVGSYFVMNHLRSNMMPSMKQAKPLYMHDMPNPENELRP